MNRARAAFHHAIVIQHRLDGAKEALYIHPEAQMLHIIAIQPGFIGNFQLIPAVDLRPAGQTGSDVVGTILIPLGQQIILIPERRPRPDDRHIPHKDVPQLRQLV